MSQVLSVISHLRYEDAVGTRTCRAHKTGRNEKKIKPGERHLVVEHPGQGAHYYCLDAAGPILEKAQADLQDLVDAL